MSSGLIYEFVGTVLLQLHRKEPPLLGNLKGFTPKAIFVARRVDPKHLQGESCGLKWRNSTMFTL